MPQIISTPEDWFRTHQRDLYVINYHRPEKIKDSRDEEERNKYFKKVQTERNDWFAQHLPNTPLGIVGPSEYSGWIEGGPLYFTADFDQVGLATFRAAWGPESFWDVEVWSFTDWRDRVDAAKILPSPLGKPQKLRWWDAPQGVLLLSADAEDHILSINDGWWKLQQICPEFAEHEYVNFPFGEYWPRNDPNWKPETHLIVVDLDLNFLYSPSKYAEDQKNIQRLKNALSIPENEMIEIMQGSY